MSGRILCMTSEREPNFVSGCPLRIRAEYTITARLKPNL